MRRHRRICMGDQDGAVGCTSVPSGVGPKGSAANASTESAVMHEYGLERPEARTGWLSRATAARRPRRRRKLIRPARTSSLNLALQGGGAHGAFTWGVLDRLLEAERFRYEGISGTSAGAINAVVFASGWLAGGAAGARANLAELWREVAEIACPLHVSGVPVAALEVATQLLSPYQLNPFD